MRNILLALLMLSATTGVALALPPGGGGGGNYDCARCQSVWIPGTKVVTYQCVQMESGDGGGCSGGTSGCTFTGGCVSLPGVLANGLSL